MGRALWTPLAEHELEEILFYIRVTDGRPETARRIGQEIIDVADRLSSDRLAGHVHPAAPDNWLYVRYKRWIIFYQPHAADVEVVRIIDATRDLPSIVASGE